jgi:hypothetical protein
VREICGTADVCSPGVSSILGFLAPGNQPASGEDDQRERRWQILAGAGCVAALQVLAEAGQRGLIRREADGSRASGT